MNQSGSYEPTDPTAIVDQQLDALVANASSRDGTSIGQRSVDGASVLPPESGSLSSGAGFGAYRIDALLGRGGMGAVYRAAHVKLGKTVALKVLPAARFLHPDAVKRFEREIQAVGRLNHPNVVVGHDAGEVDGTHFLAMELIEGEDLSKLASRHGPLPVAEACEIIRQAAQGLHHAHENGLIHRDIKPSNLILDKNLAANGGIRVKLLDLGLARLFAEDSPSTEQITHSGQVMGTFEYMPPEQAAGDAEVDERSDIYSLGATLYRLLTGVPPVVRPEHNSPLKKLAALATQEPTPIRELRQEVPDKLASLIHRMLARDPSDRPGNAAEIARELSPFARSANLASLVSAADREGSKTAFSDPEVKDSTVGVPHDRGEIVRSSASSDRTASAITSRTIVAMAVMLFFGVSAITVFPRKSSEGELIIDSVIDDVVVNVWQDGRIVRENWKLAAGENRASIPAGEIHVEPAVIHQGDWLAEQEQVFLSPSRPIRVRLLRKPSSTTADTPVSESPPDGVPPEDAIRTIALRVLSRGGSVSGTVEGVEWKAAPPSPELPAGPVRIHSIALERQNAVQDEDLNDFGRLTDLEYLHLGGTSIGEVGLSKLEGLASLRMLFLQNTKVTERGLRRLSMLPELRYLTIGAGANAGSNLRAIASLKALRSLSVESCTNQTLLGLDRLSDSQIKELELQGTFDESDSAIDRFQRTNAGCRLFVNRKVRGTDLVRVQAERLIKSGAILRGRTMYAEPQSFIADRTQPLPGRPFRVHAIVIPRDASLASREFESLSNFLSLGSLKIESRHLDYPAIAAISRCFDLHWLDLTGSKLPEHALVDLGSLRRLQYLALRKSELPPAAIAQLREALHGCRIEWSDLRAGDRTAAEWVLSRVGTARGTQAGKVWSADAQSPELPEGSFRLTAVYLNERSTFTDEELGILAQASSLRQIHLNNSTLGDRGLEILLGFPELTQLFVASTRVTAAGLSRLDALSNLESIQWTFHAETEKALEKILGQDSLRTAFVFGLPQEGQRRLAGLEVPHLRSLHITTSDGWDNEATDAFLRRNPRCRIIDISTGHARGKDPFRTEAGRLLEANATLEFAALSKDAKLARMTSESGVPHAAFSVFIVTFPSDTKVSDDEVAQLDQFPMLGYVRLSGTGITDAATRVLSECRQLTALDLDSTAITDASVGPLSQLRNATRINLRRTHLTADGIESLRRALPDCLIEWSPATPATGTVGADADPRNPAP
ncbi:MAG: protein kinase [Planctomycetaceae bacterium]|nr:protein kinase [Planctomycetaceae bacterium]